MLERLADLALRRARFTFDLRGNCLVYTGIVCAYRATQDSARVLDLPAVVAHAMAHDGIVGGWTDPQSGRVQYDSCRLFTDLDMALRFARGEGQRSVYNLNREEEITVHDEQRA